MCVYFTFAVLSNYVVFILRLNKLTSNSKVPYKCIKFLYEEDDLPEWFPYTERFGSVCNDKMNTDLYKQPLKVFELMNIHDNFYQVTKS